MEQNLEKDSQQTKLDKAPVADREHLCPTDHTDEVRLLESVMPIRKMDVSTSIFSTSSGTNKTFLPESTFSYFIHSFVLCYMFNYAERKD